MALVSSTTMTDAEFEEFRAQSERETERVKAVLTRWGMNPNAREGLVFPENSNEPPYFLFETP